MVNVRTVSVDKSASSENGMRFPYYRNVGNARFFINEKNQDTVEQDGYAFSFSPPSVSDHGFIIGEPAIYEEFPVKKFILRLGQELLVQRESGGFEVHASYVGETCKVLQAINIQKRGICNGPLWYFDQLVNNGGKEIFIAGDVSYFTRPICSDFVKLSSSLGRDQVRQYIEDVGLNKDILSQFDDNFDGVCFHLFAEAMIDLNETLDRDDAVVKGLEIQRIGAIISREPLKRQLEAVVDHWLSDSPYRNDWKKILL